MFNPQSSFSVQSFPLKPVEHPSQDVSWSSSDPHSQHLSNFSWSAVAGPSTSPAAKGTSSTVPDGPLANLAACARSRTDEELQLIQQTAAGFAACFAADHAAVLRPDVDTPFIDAADVVNRLLPYHVFQQPDEDMKLLLNRKYSKGKEKAERGEIREEIKETRIALSCHKRLKKLQDRFYRAKIKAGTRPSPDSQAYILAQSILELERSETAAVSSDLRSARNELDAIQREKRATSTAAASHPTVTTFRPAYYPPATPSQYYRTYSYAYTQPYSTATQGAVTSTFYSTPSTTSQAPVASTSYTPSASPIPVQLPITSLAALHALGIVPIPAASLPPPDQPQPPAVLKGSTSNGTMLSLDINVSLLQSAQMSGLGVLLNSLMSRGVGPGHSSAASWEQPVEQTQQNGVSSVVASVTPTATQEAGDGTE
ncbi:hypothetical protein PAXRUDRAFT_821383 [Paxillus rubicundulus Ve08.2h10]|uniref:GLTSCR protein conserved domain-containing protein n=1 Tax=Paxillus rubicundulus Ve08.2h10 TaxID=930991 RepID=A0A0D0DNW6_9AGAM|nr:hypothetical protein PAXRUDRAFT_821383 [Paxillus rubicundulus Ve08.2h10]